MSNDRRSNFRYTSLKTEETEMQGFVDRAQALCSLLSPTLSVNHPSIHPSIPLTPSHSQAGGGVGTDMACLCRVRPAGVHVHGVQLCPRARAKATRTCDAPCSCRAPTCLRARGMHARPVAHRPPPLRPLQSTARVPAPRSDTYTRRALHQSMEEHLIRSELIRCMCMHGRGGDGMEGKGRPRSFRTQASRQPSDRAG